MFFIIYCPSIVGINQPVHVIFESKISGAVVVIKCRMTKNVANFVNRGKRNNIPITISKTAKSFRNKAGAIIGNVFPNKAKTRGVAGLTPINFNIPNQKNTTNNAILPMFIYIVYHI